MGNRGISLSLIPPPSLSPSLPLPSPSLSFSPSPSSLPFSLSPSLPLPIPSPSLSHSFSSLFLPLLSLLPSLSQFPPFLPLSPFSFSLTLTLVGEGHSHSLVVAHCKRHFWNSLMGLSLPRFTIFDAEASDRGRLPSPSGMNLGCRPGRVGRKKGAGLSCLGGSTGLLCC